MHTIHALCFALAIGISASPLTADAADPNPATPASPPVLGQQVEPARASSVDAESWRYRWHDGRWWYWLPNRQWVYWDGSKWNDVIGPPGPATVYVTPSPAPIYPSVWPYNDPNYYPYSPSGRWNGPWRPGAGWVGGFFSTGGGSRSQ